MSCCHALLRLNHLPIYHLECHKGKKKEPLVSLYGHVAVVVTRRSRTTSASGNSAPSGTFVRSIHRIENVTTPVPVTRIVRPFILWKTPPFLSKFLVTLVTGSLSRMAKRQQLFHLDTHYDRKRRFVCVFSSDRVTQFIAPTAGLDVRRRVPMGEFSFAVTATW